MPKHTKKCECMECLYLRQVKKIDAEHGQGFTTVEQFAERQIDAAAKYLLTQLPGFSIRV